MNRLFTRSYLLLSSLVVAPIFAGGFVSLPSPPTTGNDLRVLGNSTQASDPFFLGSGWAPAANGYTLLDSKSTTFTYVIDGKTTNIGTFYDAVYRRTSDSQLMFACRLMADMSVTTEITQVWRRGYTGTSASVAWYADQSTDVRLRAAARTKAQTSSSAASTLADSNYDADWINLNSEADVGEKIPNTGWLLIQTSATSYETTSGAVHLRQTQGTTRPLRDWILDGFIPALAAAKPAVAQGGVVNGASGAASIVAGSWVTIYGTNLSQTTRDWTTAIVNNQLPTELDNVKVSINAKPAYIYYISPGQLNVLAPSDDGLGSVSVQVTNPGGTSDAVTATLQKSSPAFFLWNNKYVVAQHADYSLLAPSGLFSGVTATPAKPGETVILWSTGFGPTNPPVEAGKVSAEASPLPSMPVVTIGNLPATVTYAGLAASSAGLYQINVTIPTAAASGDQPVVVQYGGQQSPSGTVITVQP